MGRRGRPVPDLVLTNDERVTLTQWTRRRTTAQALATRARIVLACADGLTNSAVAVREAVTRPTVGRWRQRFVDHRCAGLLDEPKPGAPRTITDEMVREDVAAIVQVIQEDIEPIKNFGNPEKLIGVPWKQWTPMHQQILIGIYGQTLLESYIAKKAIAEMRALEEQVI